MPQLSFFIGAAGVGILGIPAGMMNFYLAWDPFEAGVNASVRSVYTWMGAASVLGGGRVRSFEPIKTAKLPDTKAYFGFQQKIVKFKIESGGTGMTDIVDLTFEVYDNESKLLYSASPVADKPLKVQIKGFSTANSLGVQTRLENVSSSESQDIFDALMTRDGPIW